MEQPTQEPKRRRTRRPLQAAAAAGGSRGPQPAPGPRAGRKAAPPPSPAGATTVDGGSTRCPFARILLPELLQRIAGFMEGNEVACTWRLVCKSTASALQGPRYATVRLSKPSPAAAFALQWGDPDALRSLNREQREQLELLTARSGSIANLRRLAARGDTPRLSRSPRYREPLLVAAARDGRLDMCSWLRQEGVPATADVLAAAAESGELALVQSLVDAEKQRDLCSLAQAAARCSHVRVLDWLLGHMPSEDVDAELVAGVAHGCTLDVLQRVAARFYAGQQEKDDFDEDEDEQEEEDDSELLDWVDAAAGSPTPDWQDKVEWLEDFAHDDWSLRNGVECLRAARQPDARARLQWLTGRGYSVTLEVACAAAEAGNAEALQYVLDQGVYVDVWCVDDIWEHALDHGHLPVAHVLQKAAGFEVYMEQVLEPAARGQLSVVAWAAEQRGVNFELSADLFQAAVLSGSWPLLRWLHERGCPWDASAFATAAGSCSEEQLEWLVERGCPMGDDGAAYATAARTHDLLILRCLRQLGCPYARDGGTFTNAVCAVLWDADFALPLFWLLEVGCPVDWAAALDAASSNTAAKAWLQAQRQQREEAGVA